MAEIAGVRVLYCEMDALRYYSLQGTSFILQRVSIISDDISGAKWSKVEQSGAASGVSGAGKWSKCPERKGPVMSCDVIYLRIVRVVSSESKFKAKG